MDVSLNETEARVIGSMVEKEITTPDLYPMTLNYIKTACNQKSSRHPVMQLEEDEVQLALNKMRSRGLIMVRSEAGSRAQKYEHLFPSVLKLSEAEKVVLGLLLLRGPQTPGEIKTRSGRMYAFESVPEVDNILHELSSRETGALVTKLPREPGQKESRYGHTLTEESGHSITGRLPGGESSDSPGPESRPTSTPAGPSGTPGATDPAAKIPPAASGVGMAVLHKPGSPDGAHHGGTTQDPPSISPDEVDALANQVSELEEKVVELEDELSTLRRDFENFRDQLGG